MNNSKFYLKALAVALGATCFTLPSNDAAHAAVFYETKENEVGYSLTTATSLVPELGNVDRTVDRIEGRMGATPDLYRIYVPDPVRFVATTESPLTAHPDTQLWLFDSNGRGLFASDNTNQNDIRYSSSSKGSTIRISPRFGTGVLNAGIYYLGISPYNIDPISVDGDIFPDEPTQRRKLYTPDDVLSSSPISGWRKRPDTPPLTIFSYTIVLRGVEFLPQTPTPSPNSSPSPTPLPIPTPIPTSTGRPAPGTGSPSPIPVPSPTLAPTPTPTPTSTPTPAPTSTPTSSPSSTPTPTPTFTPTPSPGSTPTPTPTFTPTPSPSTGGKPDSVSVPEPSSILALIGLAALGWASRSQRKR
jgi:hypothetical protein